MLYGLLYRNLDFFRLPENAFLVISLMRWQCRSAFYPKIVLAVRSRRRVHRRAYQMLFAIAGTVAAVRG